MPRWFRIFRTWLPAAIAVTVACALTYGAVQQVYRSAADDPQVQIASDGAAALNAGAQPNQIAGDARIDLATSLSTWIVVFDSSNNPVASNCQLGGNIPIPPIDALDAARSNGVNRVTWEPAAGQRFAVVAAASSGGSVVVAGRSLRSADERIGRLGTLVLAAWAVGLIALLVAAWSLLAMRRRLSAAAAATAEQPAEAANASGSDD